MYFTAQLKKSVGALTFRQIILAFALLVILVGQVSANQPVEEQKREIVKGFDPKIYKRETVEEQKREIVKGFDPKIYKRETVEEQKREVVKGFDPKVYKRGRTSVLYRSVQKRDTQKGFYKRG